MTEARTKIEMPSEKAAKEAAKLFVEYDFCTHVGKEKKEHKGHALFLLPRDLEGEIKFA